MVAFVAALLVVVALQLHAAVNLAQPQEPHPNCFKTLKQQVRYDLDLITFMFTKYRGITHMFEPLLPDALMAVDGEVEDNKEKLKHLKLVEALFDIIQQHETLDRMKDTTIARVLKKVLDHLYKDTCKYIQSKFEINCSNQEQAKRDLSVIKLRLLTVNAAISLFGPGFIPDKRRNQWYIQLEKALPSCTERQRVAPVFGRNLFCSINETIEECGRPNCQLST